MKRWLLHVAFIAIAANAAARAPDGILALIQSPNNGIPALVTPGGTFDALLTERAALRLVAKDSVAELQPEWTELPGGRVKARCVVVATTPPGAYSLVADTGQQSDSNVRAVFVVEGFPDSYAFAHITDTHIGSNRATPRADVMLKHLLQGINDQEVSFVLVTGDLTDTGDPEQFRTFCQILDTCRHPTFVCPGNHDRQAQYYEHFFGALTYMFWFGQDGYLSFDTKDYVIADDLGPQDADLEVFRRAIKRARWSLGFTHRYDPDMGMRSQIVLFVDDPLDALIFGHWHRENREDESRVPWAAPRAPMSAGATRILVTPAAFNGAFRLIDVTPRGIYPRAVQSLKEHQ